VKKKSLSVRRIPLQLLYISSLYMYLFTVVVKVHLRVQLAVILTLINPFNNVTPFISKPHFSTQSLSPLSGLSPSER
jgi:hypothetical protein